MSRILLDHNLAVDLRDLLPGHDVRHAVEMGWDQIGNGELLTIAEAAGFEIVITADQNIRYQQNLSGRRLLSLVVVSTNHWPTLRGSIGLIVETIGLHAAAGLPPSVQSPERDRCRGDPGRRRHRHDRLWPLGPQCAPGRSSPA